MKNTSSIAAFEGVGKPEQIIDAIRRLKAGDREARSYLNGVLKFYATNKVNKYLVPLILKALRTYQ